MVMVTIWRGIMTQTSKVKHRVMVGLFSLQMVDLDSKVKLKQLLSIKEDVKSKATTGAY